MLRPYKHAFRLFFGFTCPCQGPGVRHSGHTNADTLSCTFTIVIHSTARRSGDSPEARLAAWWRAGRGATGGWLVADDGSRWRVRHPGRVNQDAGPDFVEAVLETLPGAAVRGAVVELHHRASDWQAHGHDLNPRYNTVTLHLILVENRPSIPTLAANGRRIPRVVIDPARLSLPARPVRRQRGDAGLWTYGCQLPGAVGRDRQRAAHVIGMAGDIRLAWLTRIFRLDLARATLDGDPALPATQIVEQVLYEGIADALGFSQNRTAMRQLARSVPLAALPRADPLGADYPDTLASAATTLLTAAKLVPAAPHQPPRQLPLLAGATEPQSAVAAPRSVHNHHWQANRTRPGNAPVRRIVALAALAVSWPPQGLGQAVLRRLAADDPAGSGRHRGRSWSALAGLVRQPAPPPAVVRHLRRLDVWPDEEAFSALIGASRAADIVVNVLLPYSLAVARDGPPGTGQRARRVFLEHPLLVENWITRLMSKRTGFRARTAREQQGLIRLYEHYSHSLFCKQCPLGDTLPTTAAVEGHEK